MTVHDFGEAIEDFRRVRRQAAMQQLLSKLTGKPDRLLAYDEVRQIVGERGRYSRGLQDVPLDAIVGSVGRYSDFTRSFLPRSDSMESRWARVKTVATGMGGWPPIEVYKLGNAYFVIDGNHRVSVAREMGLESIPGYVTEIKTEIPISPGVETDDLVLEARHLEFLERTGLADSRPHADLRVTRPGAYALLEDHIAVHRHYMGIEREREIPTEEAATHWFDTVFEPVVYVIRERGLLRDFPDRTEADLYLWLAEHRAELEAALGWKVRPDDVAEDLVTQRSSTPQRLLARVGDKLREALQPDELDSGPPAGEWRSTRLVSLDHECLFPEVLVALDGKNEGWIALEQALVVAKREGGEVRGLHVTSPDEVRDEAQIQQIRERFKWRAAELGVPAQLVVEAGPVPRILCDRARWNDLLVVPLSHPPGVRVLDKLGSGMRAIIHRCSRPILTVPGHVTQMERALLAYDDSPKAREALFVATYLVGRWDVELVVVTVSAAEEDANPTVLAAKDYLRAHGVQAQFDVRKGDPADGILAAAKENRSDLLVLGGYHASSLVEIVIGSTLDDLLRRCEMPMLICR